MGEHHELRWGGLAGLGYAAAAVIGYFIAGAPPQVDDGARAVTSYFADSRGLVMAQVLLTCIAAACLVWFATAIAQALRVREPDSDLPWVVLAGTTLVAGLMFVAATLRGALAFRDAGAATMPLFDTTQILMTVVGIAAALPLVAVSLGVARTHLFPMWMAWFAGVCAILGVVGAFGIGTTTGALVPGGWVMSLVPFLLSTAWVVAGSAFLVREHLPAITATPQAMGHA